MATIAFVTTCKGRLHHIKQTLPLMAAQNPDEIVVVDYGCPDGVGDWVEANHPSVKVVRVNDDPGFCVSRARNLGVSASSSSWVCLIDADVKAFPGWLDYMRKKLRQGHFYRAGLVNGVRDSETFGTLFCARVDFDAMSGYDELMRGWGAEDKEFFARLSRHGLVEEEYPAHFVMAIRHDDKERIAFQEVRHKKLQDNINVCYSLAKGYMMEKFGVAAMPLETRTSLMRQVREQFFGKESINFDPNTASEALRRNRIQVTIEPSLTGATGKPCFVSFEIIRKRRYVLFGPSAWEIGR